MKSIAFLLIFLLTSPALAATVRWKEAYTGAEPGSPTSDSGGLNFSSVQKANPGRTYYYTATGSGGTDVTSDQSEVLDVSGCSGGPTLFFVPNTSNSADVTDASLGTSAKGQWYYTANPTASSSGKIKLGADINDTQLGIEDYEMTGDAAVDTDPDGLGTDNRAWIQSVKFPWIIAKFTRDLPNGTTGGFFVFCPLR